VSDINWIPVYTAQGRLSAEMIRLLLESFGVTAILSQESVGTIYGLTIGDLGEVDILVQENQIEDAREILKGMEEGKLEVEDPSSDDTGESDGDLSVD
jgi:hypothetical protein